MSARMRRFSVTVPICSSRSRAGVSGSFDSRGGVGRADYLMMMKELRRG